MVTVGGVLSITTVVDGLLAVAEFPALSDADPAGTVKPIVPSPVTSTNCMVLELLPVPANTFIEPLMVAVPVLLILLKMPEGLIELVLRLASDQVTNQLILAVELA